MSIPLWVTEELQARGAAYEMHTHPTEHTIAGVARREGVPGVRLAKVVVVIVDEKPALFVMPAYGRVNLVLATIALRAKDVRLASEDEIAHFLPGTLVGAVPPLRHWPGVELWMDPSLRHDGELVFQAGTHEDVIRMDFADWLRVAEPKVATFTHATFIGA